MKKSICFLLLFVLIVVFVGCDNNSANNTDSTSSTATINEPTITPHNLLW